MPLYVVDKYCMTQLRFVVEAESAQDACEAVAQNKGDYIGCCDLDYDPSNPPAKVFEADGPYETLEAAQEAGALSAEWGA